MPTHRPSFILARGIASMVALSSTVFAADWIGGTSSDWNDPTNWTGGVVPAGQNAYIGIAGGGNPPFTATITADVPQANDILVARGGGPGILNHTAGIASTGNDQWVDIGTAGGTGTYNLADTTTTGGFLTGFGTGSGTLRAGGGNGGNGRLYVGGVDFDAGGGTGFFNVNTSGTVQIDNDLAIGTSGGTGLMNVDAGTITTGGWNFIGKPGDANVAGGNGTLKMSGGSLTNGGGRTYIGRGTTTGRIELSGTGVYNNPGDWTSVGENNLASATASSIDISGGGKMTSGLLVVGGSPDAAGKGDMVVSGATALLDSAELYIGNRATSVGTMIVSAGTVNSASWLAIGRDGSTGSLTMSGNAVVNQGAGNASTMLELTNFGVGGTATVDLGGTSVLHVNGIVHNGGGGGVSTVNFNGGTLKARRSNATFMEGLTTVSVQAGGAILDSNGFAVTINQSLLDGGGGGGLTKIGAGSATLSGTNSYTGVTAANGGNLIISGNNFTGTGSTIGTAGTLTFGAGGFQGMIDGPVTVTGALGFNRADDLTYNETITGTGTVNQNGVNALTIGGSTAGFTGTTNVNSGSLILNNTQGGTVAVNSGGRLTPIVSNTGDLTVGSLSLNTNSTTDFEFGGGLNDKIVIAGGGTLSFGSAFTLNFYDVGTLDPFSTNGIYTLFDYQTILNGSLSNLVVGNPVPGKGYALNNVGAGTTVTLTISTVTLTAWNNTGGGTWTLPGNWTAGVPNSQSAEAVFGPDSLTGITTPSAVDMNGGKTVGKLSFDNLNSYTINGAGTLTLDNGATASTITIATGSHFIDVPITTTGNLSITTAIGTGVQLSNLSGGNALTTNGSGTVTLNGTGAYSNTTVNGGNLNIGAGGTTGSLGTGPVLLGVGTQISFNRSDAIAVSNNISGSGALNQNGAGTLTYSGAATHTGATNLNSGSFVNAGSISGTSNLFIQNNTTFQAGSTTAVAGSSTVTNSGTLTTAGAFSNTGDLSVDNNATLTVTGGTLSSNGAYIGSNGAATVNMSAGTWTTNQWTVLADNASGSATVEMTGGTWNQNHGDWLSIGQRGTGVFNMRGNSRLNDQAVVDTSNRNTNKGNVVVGRWSSAPGGSGEWNLYDNAQARIRSLVVGDQAGTYGEVNVNGSAAVVSQDHDLFLGVTGTGVVNVNSGSMNFNQGWVFIGRNSGSDGTLNVNGGTFQSSRFFVGENSTGAVNVTAGTLTSTDGIRAGGNNDNNATGTGTVTVSGGLLQITGGETQIGDDTAGTGFFYLNGGAVTTTTNLHIGADGNGTYEQTGGTFDATGGFPVVGRFASGIGTMAVSGGVFTQSLPAGRLIIGEAGNGTATVSGSGIINAQGIQMGHASTGNGTLNINTGGTVLTGFIQKTDAFSTALLNFNGGTLKARQNDSDFLRGFDATSSEITTAGAIIDTNSFAVSITTSTLDGPGKITKNGLGTLTLDTPNAHAGGVALNQGTLSIRNDGALGTGALTVNSGNLIIGAGGLFEGRVSFGTDVGNAVDMAAIPHDAVTFGTPKANSTDTGAFGDNSTWGYEGSFLVGGNAPVNWTFGEQFDDTVWLKIDGAVVLNDQTWNNPTSGTVLLTPGIHTIELRLGQGGGGVGPNSGWPIGFGYDPLGLGTTNAANFQAMTGEILFNDGIVTLANNVTLNATTDVSVPLGSGVIDGVISGAGGLTKSGDGTLTLNSTNTYTGATLASDGTLEFGASQTLTSLTILDGATVVVLQDPPPPAPAFVEASALAGDPQAGAIPEPSALGLLAVGAIGFLGRRRRRTAD